MRHRRLAVVLLAVPLLIAGLAVQGGVQRSKPTIEFIPDQTTVEECRSMAAGGGDPIGCYRQALGNIAVADGPTAALSAYQSEAEGVPQLYGGCHPITHWIGSAGLIHFKNDVGAAFVAGNDTCASGYYHGVVERAFFGAPLDENSLWAVSERLCDAPAISAVAYLSIQCFHGLGHGLMLATDYDLPVSDAICGRYADSLAAGSCYLGLFMENFDGSYGVTSPWVVDGDLGSVCASLDGPQRDIARSACYNGMIYRIARRSGRNAPWAEYVDACESIDPIYAGACYNGFGREVYTKYSIDFVRQHAAMRQACLAAPPEGALRCVIGVAGHVSYTDGDGSRAAGFCNEFEGEYRAGCFGEIGSFLSSLEGGWSALPGRCEPIVARPADLAACTEARPPR